LSREDQNIIQESDQNLLKQISKILERFPDLES